jgi:TPR repeat protein
MSTPYYVTAYHNATRRHLEGCQDDLWEEWLEELGKIREAWKWSVAGMLTQLDTGDPEIWHALGDASQNGRGIERDVEQAEQWFRKSAEAGHLSAMIRLGHLLGREERNPEELAESVMWYRRAAELGDTSGMTSLGFAYREGRGVSVDEREATDWFIRAHTAGAKHAAELAGRLLSYHRDNHLEAVKWLRTAVDHGYDSVFYNLALIYEDRESPEYDVQEAFCCWSQVAERPRGDLRFMAMLTLARCCREGTGTDRDRQQAKQWLDRLMALAPNGKADYRHAAKLRKEIDEELI